MRGEDSAGASCAAVIRGFTGMMKNTVLVLVSWLVLGVLSRAADVPSPVVLDARDARALLFQLEEERMARELYAALGARWDAPQFSRIGAAEARHEALLRALAERAGLAPPAVEAGRFADPVLQGRYDELLARGLASRAEALAVGAAVERQDLADLRSLLQDGTHPALREVATRLAAGSERHLAAFTRRPDDRPAGRGPGPGQRCRRARS